MAYRMGFLRVQGCNIIRSSSVLSSYTPSSIKSNPLILPNEQTFTRKFSFVEWTQWMVMTKPVILAQNTLISIHEASHLPWWATVILTTVALRTFVTFPLAVHSQYNLAQFELLQPKIRALGYALKREVDVAATMHNLSQQTRDQLFRLNMNEHIKKMYIENNCHPAKSGVIVFIQIPMWVFVSFAYRKMTGTIPLVEHTSEMLPVITELSQQGILWFTDLTVCDPFFILPVLLTTTNLIIVEMHAMRTLKKAKFQKFLINVSRGFTLILLPVACIVPSCLSLYWFSSSAVGLAHNLLFLSPKFRRLCRIPPTPSESSTPYSNIKNNFLTKWKRAKS